MSRVDDVAADLERLHKGRGLDADRLLSRLGEELRRILYGDSTPDPADVRDRLRQLLQRASQELPADDRRLILEAFAVVPGARLFSQRQIDIGHWMDRHPRVVLRRLQAAERTLAEVLVRGADARDDSNPYAQRGWYVEEMESHAFLSDPRTQFYAVRTIRATRELHEITDAFTVPDGLGPDEELEMHALTGCERLEVTRVTHHTWTYRALLAAPIPAGALHELGLRVVFPSPRHMRPWNALVPLRDTRRFVAVVHHVAQDGLVAAWRHDGVPSAVMQDGRDVGIPLAVEPGVPLRAEWTGLRPGLAYGIVWSHEA